MRLKTAKTNAKDAKDATDATDACKEQLLRRGFKARINGSWRVRLGEAKPGEAYEVWIHNGYRRDYFVEILKGTARSKTISGVDWDWTSKIILRLV